MRLLTASLIACFFVVGCVRTAAHDNIERSRREFDFANALYGEGNIPGAVSHLRLALELNPENAEANIIYGLIEYGRRNLDPAEEYAERGVSLLVQQGREGATLAEARNVLGVILIDHEKYDEAISVLHESAVDAMNTAPHLAWGNMGLAFIRAGRPEEAIEPLTTSVSIQARFCVGYHRLGQAYYALERWAEAEQVLVLALEGEDEMCAQLQNAWRIRAEVRAQLGQHSGAVRDLEQCVALGNGTTDGAVCQRLLDGTSGGVPDSGGFDSSDEFDTFDEQDDPNEVSGG